VFTIIQKCVRKIQESGNKIIIHSTKVFQAEINLNKGFVFLADYVFLPLLKIPPLIAKK